MDGEREQKRTRGKLVEHLNPEILKSASTQPHATKIHCTQVQMPRALTQALHRFYMLSLPDDLICSLTDCSQPYLLVIVFMFAHGNRRLYMWSRRREGEVDRASGWENGWGGGGAGSRGNQGLLSLTGLHLDGPGAALFVTHPTSINQSIISLSPHHRSISSALRPQRARLRPAAWLGLRQPIKCHRGE